MIRHLTPLECERLQGLPDGWTDIEGVSKNARYKMLGNGMAQPTADFIMSCIARALGINHVAYSFNPQSLRERKPNCEWAKIKIGIKKNAAMHY